MTITETPEVSKDREPVGSLTAKDIENEVRKIAAADPYYIYDDFDEDEGYCRYINNGEGSCIVGKALVNLDIDPETIIRLEGNPASEVVAELLGPGEQASLEWLDTVQCEQDNGTPWGEAVLIADELRG